MDTLQLLWPGKSAHNQQALLHSVRVCQEGLKRLRRPVEKDETRLNVGVILGLNKAQVCQAECYSIVSEEILRPHRCVLSWRPPCEADAHPPTHVRIQGPAQDCATLFARKHEWVHARTVCCSGDAQVPGTGRVKTLQPALHSWHVHVAPEGDLHRPRTSSCIFHQCQDVPPDMKRMKCRETAAGQVCCAQIAQTNHKALRRV
mmetsp:Transcript_115432/g.337581  ORF Transcript_115432/g.337581 Transcript_115432/m.337581 type:complete len:203 (+) Transcript_115432:1337-1945(+)